MLITDNGYLKFKETGNQLMRRVQGYHDIRLDGMSDILARAPGASVFDIGSNRGLVSFEFANNGAAQVFGCDIYDDGVIASRHLFADLRAVRHRFEVVDLTGGEDALRMAFGSDIDIQHDIFVMLATYHKLKRIMTQDPLRRLMKFFASRTKTYFCWRGFEEEILELDAVFSPHLQRIHTSLISDIQPCAIWKRKS